MDALKTTEETIEKNLVELVEHERIDNWPIYVDVDGASTRLDTENLYMKSLEAVVICGGDWQDTYEVRINLLTNTVIEVKK